MADDIEALLAEADAWQETWPGGISASGTIELVRRLAAALRATRLENGELVDILEGHRQDRVMHLERAERERGELKEALRKTCEFGNKMGKMRLQQTIEANARADRAEAQRDAARDALREVAKLLQYGIDHGYDDDGCQSTPLAIARRALGEEP